MNLPFGLRIVTVAWKQMKETECPPRSYSAIPSLPLWLSIHYPAEKKGIANGGISSNNRAVSPIDQPVHEEPVPDFSFFPGVPGKSRLKCDFEELQFLGKGGFGNVIKVCEIPIESQTYQWTDRQKWMYRVTERQVHGQTKTDKQRDRRCMVFQAYRKTDKRTDRLI